MEFELSANRSTTTINFRSDEYAAEARRAFQSCDSLEGQRQPQIIKPLKEWKGPKTITLARQGAGFGFTLRYFVVYPPSSVYKEETKDCTATPTDTVFDQQPERLTASQALDTFFVKDILNGSPAQSSGLAEGDRIVSVNGVQLSGKSYSDVVGLIQGCLGALMLVVVPKDDDILQLVYKEHAYNGTTSPLKQRSPSSTSVSSVSSLESHNMQHAAVNKWATPIYAPSRRSSSGASSDGENGQPKAKKYDPCVQFKAGASVISPEMKFSVMVRPSRSGSVSSSGSNTPGTKLDLSTSSFNRSAAAPKEACTAFKGGRPLVHPLKVVSGNALSDRRRPSGVSPSQLNHALEQTLSRISLNTQETHTVGEPSCAAPTTVGGGRASGGRRRLSSDTVTSPGVVKRLAGVFNAQQNTPESISPTSVLRDDFKHPFSGHTSRDSSRKNSREPVSEGHGHDAVLNTATADDSNGNRITGDDAAVSHFTIDAVSPRLRHRTTSQAAMMRRNRGCNLTSLTSQATLVESDERLLQHLLGHSEVATTAAAASTAVSAPCDNTTAPVQQEMTTSDALVNGATKDGPVAKQQRETVAKKSGYLVSLDGSSPSVKRKVSSSSDGDSACEHNDEAVENADVSTWRGRRISYLMATEENGKRSPPVTQTASMAIPELDAPVEEDEDSDARSTDRQMSVESISCTDDDEDVNTLPLVKEGLLNCKLVQATRGKKKVISRTWKPVYVYLKGHVMFCRKDKPTGGTPPPLDNEHLHAIRIEGASVNIAHDYGKRKHVFRIGAVNNSEYLFQAEDTAVMMSWVNALRDCDAKREDSSDDPIAKRTKVNDATAASANSPPTHKHFGGKKSLSIKKSHFILGRVNKQKRGFVNVQISVAKDKEQAVAGFTFGTSLNTCPQAKTHQNIPLLVEHCCKVVEEKGLDYIGIYRVPGNAAAVQQLREELDTKDPTSIDWMEEKWYDLNNISSLLKSFLRKLKEPIIPHGFYERLIQANRNEDTSARLNAMKAQIRTLPSHHFETLKFLTQHLRLVADHSDINKMEPKNLAIVFGPTVVRASDENMVSMVKDMSDQCRIIETLVHQCDWVFDFEDASGSDSPRVQLEETFHSNSDNIVSSKGLMESLGQVAESMTDPTTTNSQQAKGGGKENKSVASAIMSLSNFTSSFSMKLRSKAMSPLFQKKFPKSDSVGSGDSSPVSERVTSPLEHSPTWDTDDDAEQVDGNTKSKSSKKHKLRVLAPLPSWPGVGNKSKNKSEEKKRLRSRSNSLDKDKPRLIVHMPPSPIIHRPGQEEVLKIDLTVDAGKAAMLSERTRLRLKQVSEEHQAASERRQLEKHVIDAEHRKLTEDMEKDDEDELLSPLTMSPGPLYGDSDGTASNTSDSGPTSRKASLDSLSSPVISRRLPPYHHRQVSNSSISSEERSPRLPMRRAAGEPRRYDESDLAAFDGKPDLCTVTEESHCRIPNRSTKPTTPLYDFRSQDAIGSVNAGSLDEKLRILLDPSYEVTEDRLEQKTASRATVTSASDHNATASATPTTASSAATRGSLREKPAVENRGARLPQSIRSIDSILKTKVIGLHPTSSAPNPEMTMKIDNLKSKRADLEKKVTTILQENSAAKLRDLNTERSALSPGLNRLKLTPVAQTFVLHSSSSSQDSELQDSGQRLERNVKNVTELLRTSHHQASAGDDLDLESSLTRLHMKCLKNGEAIPVSRSASSSTASHDDCTPASLYEDVSTC